jgi:hypothetical protein
MLIDNKRYLYCWLCQKYYIYDFVENKLLDKTEEITNILANQQKGI